MTFLDKDQKRDLKTILEVAVFLLLSMGSTWSESSLVKILSWVILIFILSYSAFNKLQYRMNKLPNEIRFPTQNDVAFKTTCQVLGIMTIIGTGIWIFIKPQFDWFAVVCLLSGILIFINGLLIMTRGQLVINESKLKLSGISDEIELKNITSIDVGENQIIINKNTGPKLKLERLELDEQWIDKITEFLNSKLRTKNIRINEL